MDSYGDDGKMGKYGRVWNIRVATKLDAENIWFSSDAVSPERVLRAISAERLSGSRSPWHGCHQVAMLHAQTHPHHTVTHSEFRYTCQVVSPVSGLLMAIFSPSLAQENAHSVHEAPRLLLFSRLLSSRCEDGSQGESTCRERRVMVFH